MFPWVLVWCPHFYLPRSGNVTQAIKPDTNWFFDSIDPAAGDGRVEKRAFGVASYGKQLDLLTEVLIDLAEQQPSMSPEAASSLQRLKKIRDQIENIKQEEATSLAHEVEDRIARLQKINPEEWSRLTARLRAVLSAPAGQS